jgi:hypothetical protein
MKIKNITTGKIYLGDLKLAPESQTVGRRGEDRYLAAGDSMYLPDTSEVLRSAHYGTLKKWKDAGVIEINDKTDLTASPGPGNSVTIVHGLGYLPLVTIFKKVGSTWVDAMGTYDLVHNANFTSTTVTNASLSAMTYMIRIG